jgi:hypothetical protein
MVDMTTSKIVPYKKMSIQFSLSTKKKKCILLSQEWGKNSLHLISVSFT